MEFLLLGGLAVRGPAGTVVHPPRLKHRQLLAALLLEANRPVPAARLIEALWGAHAPESAAQNLKTYIWALRRLFADIGLDRAAIHTQAGGYRLDVPADGIDLTVFRRLTAQARQAMRAGDARTAHEGLCRALALWRGEALQDARGTDLLDSAATALDEERLIAAEELTEAALALGLYTEVITEARAMLKEHPLRERPWAQLMLALHRSGQTADALAAYRELRRITIEELGVEPGPLARQTHQRILTEGPDAGPSPTAPPAPVAPPPVPRQLPRGPTVFVGRTAEAAALRAMLTSGGDTPVVVISGPAGAGKSTLARHVAHEVAGCFPDGQLYADLHGATPGVAPLTAGDLLGRFLRALGVPADAVPGDPEEAAALWRTHLAGRRVLTVLDDAADPAQVRPLLAVPPGNVVLITSRATFVSVDDCRQLELGLLPDDEALAMLTRLVGPERLGPGDPAAARLVRLCGGLPLALRIIAARLARTTGDAAAQLAARLADERHRLGELAVGDLDVQSSLRVSLDLLAESPRPADRAAARALTMLGLLRVPEASADVVAAMLDVDPVTAERALDRLVDVHLCDSPGLGRYTLHDLVRLFAQHQAARCAPAERDAALRRALAFYNATARRAAHLADPHRVQSPGPDVPAVPAPLDTAEAALAWLAREERNLLAAARQGMAADDETLLRLAIGVTFALRWHLPRSFIVFEWLALNEQALEVSRRLGDRVLETYAHLHIADACRHLGRHAEAIAHLEQELALCQAMEDRFGEQRALGNLGNTHLNLKHYEQAIAYGERQLALARRIGAEVGERYALLLLGSASLAMGRLDAAQRLLQEGVELSAAAGDTAQLAVQLVHLGTVLMHKGDLVQAETHLNRALAAARSLHIKPVEVECLLRLAELWRLRGDSGRALGCTAQARTIARDAGIHSLLGRAEEHHAALLAAEGR